MTPSDIHKVWAIGVGGLLVVLGLVWYGHNENEKGRDAEKSRQYDSTKVALSIQVDSTYKAAIHATDDAAKLRSAARAEVRKDSVRQVANDSAIAESANVRQRAVRDLADSLAAIGVLRADLHNVVQRGVADSVRLVETLAQHRHTVAALLSTVRADSTALERQVGAYAVLLKARLADQAEVATLRHQMPSFIGRHVSLTAGYGAVATGTDIKIGPAVVAGWKILP